MNIKRSIISENIPSSPEFSRSLMFFSSYNYVLFLSHHVANKKRNIFKCVFKVTLISKNLCFFLEE